MRAAQYDRYGSPDVIHLAEAPTPAARSGRILVAVHGSSVNPVEARVRSGAFRFVTGSKFPKNVGMDFAGEIVSLGDGVSGWTVGDRVWGFTGGLPLGRIGAAAEFLSVKPKWISRAATSIDLVTAGGMPMVGSTAIIALRHHAKLVAGERLLVRGASGGVGSVAVQLGVALGARVTATASATNLDFVRSLGATEAFDYRTTRPSDLSAFDVILDLSGTQVPDYHRLLARGGRMVTTAVNNVGFFLASQLLGPRRVRAFTAMPRTRYFADLAELVDSGRIVPVVGGVHPLAETAAAHAALESGTRGKQIIDVRA
jgi:NADPH:quinone reductase-like Zn-dependent oxidoreductase